ncbi:MAG: hypothetical protein HQ472_07700 [Ignavibacteria bacterium]|nr:hypothetical protein [Ignavibacteria bacterium]
MNLTLATADYIAIGVCLISALVLGFVKSFTSKGGVIGIALAGRKLTTPLFVITLVATWYGAVLAVGEFVWEYGVVVLLCFGLPYYVFAISYALFLAPRIRTSNAVSIPEQFRHKYGERAGRLASILVFLLTSPAPYVLMAAQVVSLLFGIEILRSILLVAIISLSYAAFGGLISDVRANIAQLFFMFLGFGLLLYFSVSQLGGIETLLANASSLRMSIPGSIGWMGITAWWILALQTFVDPNFHQRVSAVREAKMATKGILISVGLWMVFDFLTTATALYAVTYTQTTVPMQAHLWLAELVMPPVAKGIFVGGVLSAILSTLDGYAIVHGLTLSNDILAPFKKRPSTVSDFRNGVVVGGILSCIAAFFIPSVIDLFFIIGSVTIPGLLLPLILAYSAMADRFVKNISTRIIAPTIISIAGLVLFPSSLALALLAGILTSAFLHVIDYKRNLA